MSASNIKELKHGGFTLIEVMIVVVILGILAAIALPAYQQYLLEGRRVDGKAALMAIEAAQEKYRITNPSYTTTLAALGVSGSSPEGHYNMAVTASSATGYTATATATGVQAADAGCSPLQVVMNAGTVTKSPAACW